MGVRKDGILEVDNGGGGGGTAVDIVTPLGSQPAATSVSVAIASDQLPLPVSAVISTVGLATDVNQTNGAQKTQVVDSLGNVVPTVLDDNGKRGFQIHSDVKHSDPFNPITSVAPLFPLAALVDNGSGDLDWTGVRADGQVPTVDGSDVALFVRQVGLPLAELLADNTANPILTRIQNFGMVWEAAGVRWNRMVQPLTNAELRASVVPVTANQGTPAIVANAWPIKVSDGVDSADVAGDGEIKVAAKGLLVASYDRANDKMYPSPVLAAGYAQPDGNTLAIPVELRATTQLDGATKTRNEMVSVGGISNGASISNSKLVFSDGNSLAANPFNTFGVQTREMGHSFVNSGSISLLGQRFTVSSRYVVKAAGLFRLTNNLFIGTIRPVVSLDNGVNYFYCQGINIDTGLAASSFTDGDASGTFSIPFANGATDFGFEITARTSGDITILVSANSAGVGSVYSVSTLNGAVGANVESTDDDSAYTDGQVNKPITQTPDGRLKVLANGNVSSDPESYAPGSNRPLSLDTQGQLRVVLPEVFWSKSNPWESISSAQCSPWGSC